MIETFFCIFVTPLKLINIDIFTQNLKVSGTAKLQRLRNASNNI